MSNEYIHVYILIENNMIRIISLFCLVFFVFEYGYAQTVSAGKTFEQTDKGSHLVGGTASLNNTFSSQSSLFNVNLNPNYGYFIANNLAIGGILSLTYSSNKGSQSTLATLSPFIRYYIGPPKTCMFFGYASAGGGIESDNERKNVGLYNFQVGPGFDYFINKHVAAEALLTYTGSKLNVSGSNYNNNIGLLIGLQVFF